MNKHQSQDYQEKLEQLEKEDEEKWWRAGQKDQFDLNKKLQRVGCRPIYRKFLECDKQYQDQNMLQCVELKEELQKCLQMLKFLYATKDS